VNAGGVFGDVVAGEEYEVGFGFIAGADRPIEQLL